MNFSIEELTYSPTAIKNHIDNTPNDEIRQNLEKLIYTILQPIRDEFKRPIKVNSGYRCKELNALVGGSKTSQHVKGEAADITSSDNRKLWNLIVSMIKDGKIQVGQLINEKNLSWIHISLGQKNQIFSVK